MTLMSGRQMAEQYHDEIVGRLMQVPLLEAEGLNSVRLTRIEGGCIYYRGRDKKGDAVVIRIDLASFAIELTYRDWKDFNGRQDFLTVGWLHDYQASEVH